MKVIIIVAIFSLVAVSNSNARKLKTSRQHLQDTAMNCIHTALIPPMCSKACSSDCAVTECVHNCSITHDVTFTAMRSPEQANINRLVNKGNDITRRLRSFKRCVESICMTAVEEDEYCGNNRNIGRSLSTCVHHHSCICADCIKDAKEQHGECITNVRERSALRVCGRFFDKLTGCRKSPDGSYAGRGDHDHSAHHRDHDHHH